MLYILTALKCEAAALNGLPGNLVVTGVGESCQSALSAIDLKEGDAVLNVGVAAGSSKGEAYLINSVTAADSERNYYPDMVHDIGLSEMPLTTVTEPVTSVDPGMLYDMEGAFIMKRAMQKVAPSRIIMIKIVSDDGSTRPSANDVTNLIRQHLGVIKKAAAALDGGACVAGGGDAQAFAVQAPEELMDELKLSQYMRNEFEDISHYMTVSGRGDEFAAIISELRTSGRIPCKDKRQGKEVLSEIYSRVR